MRALDSRRATGHDSAVAAHQRPGVTARIGAAKSRYAVAGGFFHGLVRPLWAAGQRESQGSPMLHRSVNLCSVAHPFDSGSAVQKPQLEPRQMNAITQGASAPAVESLIVEGLITVKIGPRGGSSLFLAGFE